MRFLKLLHSEEKGAAVIIALGIFALILALGLNFASQSIINEKVAKNLDNKTRSEILAQSATSRLLAEIASNPNLNSLYSLDPENNNDTPGDNLSAAVEGINYQGNTNTEWIYIYNSSDVTDKDSEIIGRIAYSACTPGCSADDPDSLNFGGIGKLNAAACVDSGMNAAAHSTNAISEDNVISTSIDNSGAEVQGRPGVNVNEIYLAALDSNLSADSLQRISAENTGSGNGLLPVYEKNGTTLLTDEGNWLDLNSLFREIGINKDNLTLRNNLSKKLTVSSIKDPEAFWIMSNDSDDTVDSEELYHRFNLARTDWPDASINHITWLEENILGDTEPFNNSPTADNNGKCIPWIKNWKFPGTDTVSDTMRYQIAANLLDYCDEDDSATTDNPNSPTYTGLEKTPYINEINIDFEAKVKTITKQGDTSSFATIWLREIDLEAVNMYNNSYTNGTVNADIDISFTYTFKGTTYSQTATTTVSLPAISSGEYQSKEEKHVSDYFHAAEGTSDGITNFQITELKVKLYNSNGDFYDYSFCEQTGSTLTEFVPPLDNDEYELFINYSVNDPRQNLLAKDWHQNTTTTSNDTIGAENSNYATASGDDPENDGSTEPWNISTAYIRNAPMKSPWEIGFIHRAATWQTINLKKYNTAESSKKSAGGNLYADGDANMLDQIKMTPNTTTLGKVNINNPIGEDDANTPLSALFAYIRTNIDIYDTLAPGYQQTGYDEADSVSLTDAKLLSDYVHEVEKLPSMYPLKTRSQILTEMIGYTLTPFSNDSFIPFDIDLTLNNDAKQEEIIGKFINLTKANGKVFNSDNMTILLIGQSIKDVGGKNGSIIKINGIDAKKGRYDDGVDNVLSTTKALITISKSPNTDKWIIDRFEYIGE